MAYVPRGKGQWQGTERSNNKQTSMVYVPKERPCDVEKPDALQRQLVPEFKRTVGVGSSESSLSRAHDKGLWGGAAEKSNRKPTLMVYVPKQQSCDEDKSGLIPVPGQHVPELKKNLNGSSLHSNLSRDYRHGAERSNLKPMSMVYVPKQQSFSTDKKDSISGQLLSEFQGSSNVGSSKATLSRECGKGRLHGIEKSNQKPALRMHIPRQQSCDIDKEVLISGKLVSEFQRFLDVGSSESNLSRESGNGQWQKSNQNPVSMVYVSKLQSSSVEKTTPGQPVKEDKRSIIVGHSESSFSREHGYGRWDGADESHRKPNLAGYVPKQQSCGENKGHSMLGHFVPKFNRNLSIASLDVESNSSSGHGNKKRRGNKIIYGNKSTHMWFAVGLKNDYRLPSGIHMKAVTLTSIERRGLEEHVVLVNNEVEKSTDEIGGRLLKSPWACIAENVLEEVESAYHKLKIELGCQNLEDQHLALVARLGKIIFHRYPSAHARKNSVSEIGLRKLKRSFYTTLPPSCVEHIANGAVKEIGLEMDVKEEKDSYRVKLSDSKNPDYTISCECKATTDGKSLELYKIESNLVRHLIVDVSCFGKDLDLRLMLRTKRIANVLCDDEKQCISDLISTAVLDPNTEGGLRWPLGMTCCEERYKVLLIWHIKCTAYHNSSLKLRMRNVDRYDYRNSTSEYATEAVLNLTEMVSRLEEPNIEVSSL